MVPLEYALSALCLVAAVWLAVLVARDRRPDRYLLNGLLVLELGLLVHLVVGIVHVTGAPAGVSVWEYVGYLVGSVLLVPAGVVWSSGEETRGGTAVLLVAVLVVPFMFLRLADIWAGGA